MSQTHIVRPPSTAPSSSPALQQPVAQPVSSSQLSASPAPNKAPTPTQTHTPTPTPATAPTAAAKATATPSIPAMPSAQHPRHSPPPPAPSHMSAPTPPPASATPPPPTNTCTHYAATSLASLHGRFRTPSFLASFPGAAALPCSDCRRVFPKKDMWVCLSCERGVDVRCGRGADSACAIGHANATRHGLVLNCVTRMIWCYFCDCEVIDEYDTHNHQQQQPQPNAATPQRIRHCLDPHDPSTGPDEEKHSKPRRAAAQQSGDGTVGGQGGGEEDEEDEEDEENMTWLDYYMNGKGGEVGMSNLGNTCFMNSALQALLHTPPLIAFVSHMSHIPLDSIRQRLIADFSVLLQKVWSGHYSLVAPGDLLRDIVFINPFFRGYGQHDAQELIRCVLDQMHEGLKRCEEYEYTRYVYGEGTGEEQEVRWRERELQKEREKLMDKVRERRGKKSKETDKERKRRERDHTTTNGHRHTASVSSLPSTPSTSAPVTPAAAPEYSTTSTSIASSTSSISAASSHSSTASAHSTSAPSASSASPSFSSSSSSAPSPSSDPSKKAVKVWPDHSIISDIFSGYLQSRIRCHQCSTISTVYDQFYDLSLEIPKESNMKRIAAERGTEAMTPPTKQSWLGSLLTYTGLVPPPLSLETCLTGDHRVLTRTGWKSITRMQVGDVVMSFNINNKNGTHSWSTEWKPVIAVHSHRVDTSDEKDTLFRMQGSGMDVIATRNHRMLLARLDGRSEFGLQEQAPVGYETVGELLPPALSYDVPALSNDTRFAHSTSRSVVCAGINRQPSVKIVIPGLERVCEWWWRRDEQLRFLHFLGLWLGDGFIDVVHGTVCISQRRNGVQWLEELLRDVFPGWWRCITDSSDPLKYRYIVRCPPLYEYLRHMAIGSLGYNPRDPAQLRVYPHFTVDQGLAEVEQNSDYYQVNKCKDTVSPWTEDAMLTRMRSTWRRAVAATSSPPADAQRCWWCDDADDEENNVLLVCKGVGCQWCGHLLCAGHTAVPDGEWLCPDCGEGTAMEGVEEDEESERLEDDEPAVEEVVDDEGEKGRRYVANAVEDDEVAKEMQVAGRHVWWNNAEWLIINGHWYYLKRWLGDEQQIADVYSQLSREQAVALLDGFCRADGQWKNVRYQDDHDRRQPHAPMGTWKCSNSSFPLIDHLQLIAQLAGARVSLKLHTMAGKTTTNVDRSVSFSVDHWMLTFDFDLGTSSSSEKPTPFATAQLARPDDVSCGTAQRGYYQYEDDRRVHCITVEGNNNFLTQRLSRKLSQSGHMRVQAHSVFIGNCLHAFCTSDRLIDRDQYRCDQCKAKVDASKTLALHSLPEVLMLHVKRFAHNSYFGSKVNRHVNFPINGLDMRPFLSEDKRARMTKAAEAAAAGTASAATADDSSLYDLYAVVRHLGSVAGGHYIAYAKNHVTGKWYEFDDRIVTEISEKKLAEVEAYVLFYRHRHSDSQRKQLLDRIQDATLTQHQPAPTRFISRQYVKKVSVLGRVEPIDNRDLLCVHGVPYELPADGGQLAIPVSKAGWERLVKQYGGGPLVDGGRYECEQCLIPIIRARERKRISALDNEATHNSLPTDPFYVIHDDWLRQWRAFIQEKGQRPGPITNHMLLDAKARPRPGLVKVRDYRGLHGTVWDELLRCYGGGPVIVRKRLDIYEEEEAPGGAQQQQTEERKEEQQQQQESKQDGATSSPDGGDEEMAAAGDAEDANADDAGEDGEEEDGETQMVVSFHSSEQPTSPSPRKQQPHHHQHHQQQQQATADATAGDAQMADKMEEENKTASPAPHQQQQVPAAISPSGHSGA